MSWTDERIATLKKMWLQGKSASEIAEKLGGVTRNAVIGKAHRLNLSGRPSPIKKVAVPKKAAAAAAPAPAKKPAAAAPVAKAKPAPAPAAPKAAAPKAAAAPAARSTGPGPGKPPEIVQLAALANATSRADGKIISILELSERVCRWPVGDPRDGNFGYCGAEAYGAHPYCAEHVAIAFQAPNRKDKKQTKNVKESDVPDDLDDIEVEVEDDEDNIDDDTLADDLDDDDTPLTV